MRFDRPWVFATILLAATVIITHQIVRAVLCVAALGFCAVGLITHFRESKDEAPPTQ